MNSTTRQRRVLVEGTLTEAKAAKRGRPKKDCTKQDPCSRATCYRRGKKGVKEGFHIGPCASKRKDIEAGRQIAKRLAGSKAAIKRGTIASAKVKNLNKSNAIEAGVAVRDTAAAVKRAEKKHGTKS